VGEFSGELTEELGETVGSESSLPEGFSFVLVGVWNGEKSAV